MIYFKQSLVSAKFTIKEEAMVGLYISQVRCSKSSNCHNYVFGFRCKSYVNIMSMPIIFYHKRRSVDAAKQVKIYKLDDYVPSGYCWNIAEYNEAFLFPAKTTMDIQVIWICCVVLKFLGRFNNISVILRLGSRRYPIGVQYLISLGVARPGFEPGPLLRQPRA